MYETQEGHAHDLCDESCPAARPRDLDQSDVDRDGEAAHDEAIAKAYDAYLSAWAARDEASAALDAAPVDDDQDEADGVDDATYTVQTRATALLDLLGYGHQWVRVKVTNAYECGRESEATEIIAAPDTDPTEDNEWWQDVAFNATGDGHPCGATEGSLYTVEIIEAPHEDWVGASYEFG